MAKLQTPTQSGNLIFMPYSKESDTVFDFMCKKVIRAKPVDVEPACKSGKNLTFNVKETFTEDGSKFTEIVVGLKKGKKRRCSDGKTSNT